MKFASKVVVALPRQRVLEIIMNPDYLSRWQPGVKSVTPLSGKKDEPGARSRVVFETRGVHLEMIETVVQRNPPDEFSSTVEARGVRNFVQNRFYEDGPAQTRWVMENTFEFSGFMSVVGAFIRDFLAVQTLESMNRFKAFAESVDNSAADKSNGGA